MSRVTGLIMLGSGGDPWEHLSCDDPQLKTTIKARTWWRQHRLAMTRFESRPASTKAVGRKLFGPTLAELPWSNPNRARAQKFSKAGPSLRLFERGSHLFKKIFLHPARYWGNKMRCKTLRKCRGKREKEREREREREREKRRACNVDEASEAQEELLLFSFLHL